MTSDDKIKVNWQLYVQLLKKIDDDVRSDVEKILTKEFSLRLACSPVTVGGDLWGGEPGDLVQYAIDVATTMSDLSETMFEEKCRPTSHSIYLVGLLHVLGRAGDDENDLFVSETNSWRRDTLKKQFQYNERIPRMSPAHRTLFLLQSHGVRLTQDEWIAIHLSSGRDLDENRFYVGWETPLQTLIQVARQIVDARDALFFRSQRGNLSLLN